MPPKRSGGPPKGLASLKSMMAAKQALEAENKRLQEEQDRLEEEERKKEEEEEAKRQKERENRLEKERLKREELRRSGKLLSKGEKEKQLKNKLKLEQLLQNTSITIPPPTDGPKKKPVYSKLKKKASSKDVEQVDKKVSLPAEGDQMEEEEEEEVLEDWEDGATSSDDVCSDDSDDDVCSDDGGDDDVCSDEKIFTSSKATNNKAAIITNKAAIITNKTTTSKTEKPSGLRSPICCILGHVDTGKTKLLDKIRQTNVQEGEAGGITQQIGATFFPIANVIEKTKHLINEEKNLFHQGLIEGPLLEYRVPGLLIIDTPGHESFSNLRSRGSSLCNIAILVIDIMHGLEPQTIESIGLLRQRKSPFIVALNKIDRLYGWKCYEGVSVEKSIELQNSSVKAEFDKRVSETRIQLAEQGLNADLFFKNADMRRSVSLVPTSAITGCGIPDMLRLLIRLTQQMMSGSLMYLTKVECTVLEVKVVEGLGTTIDVILSNGVLREGDRIAICGMAGPIITNIRALLTPQPLRELRVKGQYVHNQEVKAALGVKISAPDLEKAVAGSSLLVIREGECESEEEAREGVMSELTALTDSVDKAGLGVCVQASTLGSLEALLSFLEDSKIPVSGISIGPVHKKDVIRASVALDSDKKEYACILAFDVKIEKEIQDLADDMEVKIFKADIIYHLFDQFTSYIKKLEELKKKDLSPQAVFPCVLQIQPGCVFNKRDPIILGVDVLEGILKVGTPLCVPSQGCVSIGKVTSMEVNHKHITELRKGGPSVAIKIECASYESAKTVGRHFTESDTIVSKLTRSSINVLKDNFRTEVPKEDWALIVQLKKMLGIA